MAVAYDQSPLHVPSPCALHGEFRDTFVMEFLSDQKVGTDAVGEEKVFRYLLSLAKLLNLKPLEAPRAHLSPLYGLSGWLPLAASSAIHLYAWDDRSPTFISIDVTSRNQLPHGAILRHAQSFFVAKPGCTVHKSLRFGSENWVEIEPTICRQRLAVRAGLSRKPTNLEVEAFLPDLSEHLNMVTLSSPYINGETAWMHWETSGVLVDWENGLDLDIYTCKPFVPEQAVQFIKSRLPVTDISNLNF